MPNQSFIQDIIDMNNKFQFSLENATEAQLEDFMKFRIEFLQEELDEMKKAFAEKNMAEVVDALMDLMVVAIGTTTNYQVDTQKAWDLVTKANMSKIAGVNSKRTNSIGMDLVKTADFKAPDHSDNIGLLAKLQNKKEIN